MGMMVSADSTYGSAPFTARFTDISPNPAISWNWDFGDGDSTNSTLPNPVHTYANPGTYNVSLVTSDGSGTNRETRTNYIFVSTPAPIASFTGTPTNGTAPLTVQFNDTSTNSPTARNWSFGDGNSSTAQDPVHTFTSPGTYPVNLTVSNAAGSNFLNRTTYITVTSVIVAPVAGFTSNVTSGSAPLTVQFNDTSTNSPRPAGSGISGMVTHPFSGTRHIPTSLQEPTRSTSRYRMQQEAIAT